MRPSLRLRVGQVHRGRGFLLRRRRGDDAVRPNDVLPTRPHQLLRSDGATHLGPTQRSVAGRGGLQRTGDHPSVRGRAARRDPRAHEGIARRGRRRGPHLRPDVRTGRDRHADARARHHLLAVDHRSRSQRRAGTRTAARRCAGQLAHRELGVLAGRQRWRMVGAHDRIAEGRHGRYLLVRLPHTRCGAAGQQRVVHRWWVQ